MNVKTYLISITLLAVTAYAAVSTQTRAEREALIRSQLGRNAFVNSTGSQLGDTLSGRPPVRQRPKVAQRPTAAQRPTVPQRQPSSSNVNSNSIPSPDIFDASDAPPKVTVTPNDRRRVQRLKRPGAQQRTVTTMLNLQDRIISRGGCNRNLCFTLDASTKLSEVDFLLQRDFVQLIAATLGVDTDLHIAAWQYGPRVGRISKLTPDINAFLLRLGQWQRRTGRQRNFLGGAMWNCRREVRPRRNIDANKMVIIGNGRTSFIRRQLALIVSRLFRRENGSICAVAVDNANRSFFGRLTADPALVLGITDYERFDEILTDIVTDICGLP